MSHLHRGRRRALWRAKRAAEVAGTDVQAAADAVLDRFNTQPESRAVAKGRRAARRSRKSKAKARGKTKAA